jgi:hypothetical protein
MTASHNGTGFGRPKDRKGREYLDLGGFGTSMTIRVYFSPAAKGQRRDESARIVLVGHAPELRVAIDPYRARRLDRRQAVLLLWDRLVQLIDDKAAPVAAAETFEAAMAAGGLDVPPGPLHRPGLPKAARLILAYREAHPAASQRMVAAAVRCDPARVCQVYRRYGDPASAGAERRAECALNTQRRFSADSAREQPSKALIESEENLQNGNHVPEADSAHPPCTSSSLREEDDGAPPPDANVPRPALGGPSRPVVAGHVGDDPRPNAGERPRLPPGFEVVPEELRPIIWAVVAIEAARPGKATLWAIGQRVRKPDGDLDRAVELQLLDEGGHGGARWWTPKHPSLIALVDLLRCGPRSHAS